MASAAGAPPATDDYNGGGRYKQPAIDVDLVAVADITINGRQKYVPSTGNCFVVAGLNLFFTPLLAIYSFVFKNRPQKICHNTLYSIQSSQYKENTPQYATQYAIIITQRKYTKMTSPTTETP